jgi:hypothetical protein
MLETSTMYRTKEQVLVDLSKALRFSPESLEANRKGKLTAEQVKQFSGRCFQPLVLAVIFAAAPLLIWAGMISMHEHVSLESAVPTFLGQFQHMKEMVEAHGKIGVVLRLGSMLLGLGIAFLYVSRLSPGLYFDLIDRKVIVKEGRITAREEQLMKSNGRDPVETYFFNYKLQSYKVNLAAFRAIENGSVYLLYLLPRSDTLVSIEPKMGGDEPPSVTQALAS